MNTLGIFAWRNLGRNPRRSFITGAGIALGVALCMAALGIMNGLNANLIRGTVDGQLGAVQLHHPEYLRSHQLRWALQPVSLLHAELKQHPGVSGVSARLFSWGYLSHGEQSVGVQLVGLDPLDELGVTSLPQQVIAGSLAAAPVPWRTPEPLTEEQQALDQALTEQAIAHAFAELEQAELALGHLAILDQSTRLLVDQLAPLPDEPPQVVLGDRLARNLRANLGDTLSLLYESGDGVQQSMQVMVSGISSQGTDFVDRTRVLVHLQDLQNILRMPDQAQELAVAVAGTSSPAVLAEQLRGHTRLQAFGPVTIRDWQQIRPDILALVTTNQALMGSLVFIVFLIAGVGVLNAMLVGVMERQKELSVLKAIGCSRRFISGMVMLETLVLSILATMIGLLLGAALIGYLSVIGWDISQFGEFSVVGVGMASVLKAEPDWNAVMIPVLTMFFLALLAAIYPAIRAASVSPAQGMRQ